MWTASTRIVIPSELGESRLQPGRYRNSVPALGKPRTGAGLPPLTGTSVPAGPRTSQACVSPKLRMWSSESWQRRGSEGVLAYSREPIRPLAHRSTAAVSFAPSPRAAPGEIRLEPAEHGGPEAAHTPLGFPPQA